MIMHKSIGAGFIFAIFVLGIALRIHGINKYDLWFDELSSDMYSAQKVMKMAESNSLPLYMYRISRDCHSSLYYLLVYGYSSIFGGGKSLRVVSLIFSVLSLALFYKLSRILLKRSESLWAILLMALSPFHIWYAQEARAYTVALFFILLAAYFYIQALRIGKLLYWFLFAISSALAIYLSYYSIFLIVISGLLVFSKNNYHNIKRWFLSILAVSILLLPLALLFIHHYNFIKDGFWLFKPSLKDTFITLAVFNLGYSAGYIELIAGLVLFFTLFIYGAYSFYKINREYAVMLFLFVSLPITATYLFSIWQTPIYISRQFFIFTPFYYLLIAKGLGSIKNKSIQSLLGAGVVVVLIFTLLNYYRGFMLPSKSGKEFYIGIHQKKTYGNLLADIDGKIKDNDLIATTDVQSFAIVSIYYLNAYNSIYFSDNNSRVAYFLFYPFALTELEKKYLRMAELINVLPEDDKRGLYSMKLTDRYSSQDSKALFHRVNNRLIKKYPLEKIEAQRIWLISSIWDKQANLSYNSILVRSALAKYFKKQTFIAKDGILVELYFKSSR